MYDNYIMSSAFFCVHIKLKLGSQEHGSQRKYLLPLNTQYTLTGQPPQYSESNWA